MPTRARMFAKFERVFKDLTTDDIIKLITEYFTPSQLYEFLEHCQEEQDCSDIDIEIDFEDTPYNKEEDDERNTSF